MNKYLSIVGLSFTSLYSIALFCLIRERFDSIWSMPLNELGDFFAGVFGPLAILWFILGFFQQGIELRQNTSALELQAQELKNSVEQQKELVNVSKEQFNASLSALNYERELQRKNQLPIFIVKSKSYSISDGEMTYKLSIRNVGQVANDVVMTFSHEERSGKQLYWEKDMILPLETVCLPKELIELTISYVDSLGERGENKFEFIFDNSVYPADLKIKKIQS